MKKSLKKSSFVFLLALAGLNAQAQQPADSAMQQARYKEINALNNIQAYSQNPVRLTRNTLRNVGQGTFDVNYEYGDFRKVDGTKHQTDFGVVIEGLRQIGKFDLSGQINYRNYKYRDHKWNNTLFLSEDNPFVFADSLKSEANLEQFELETVDTWRLNDKLTLGMDLGLLIGEFSDQADPRPKTDASIVKIRPAMEWKLNDTWQIGAMGGVDLYRSRVAASIINAQVKHTFFLLKGLGDYQRFSTADYYSWTRDYEGYNYVGAIQLTTTPQGADWQNFLELHGNYKTEIATDGGSEWKFKGGDYDCVSLGLTDNWMLRKSNKNHRLTLNADVNSGSGKWYDQVKRTDSQHGNRNYYDVVDSYDIYESMSLSTKLEYQLDFLKHDIPSLTLRLGAKSDYKQMKNLNPLEDVAKQNYMVATVFAGAAKHVDYKLWQFSAALDAAYRMNLGTPKFNAYDYYAGGKNCEIVTMNIARNFAYNSASVADFGLHLNARTYFSRSKIGLDIFANVNYLTYLGMYDDFEINVADSVDKMDYTNPLDGKDRIRIQAGFAITF